MSHPCLVLDTNSKQPALAPTTSQHHHALAPLSDYPSHSCTSSPLIRSRSMTLPIAKQTFVHPTSSSKENASVYFVGTATTIFEWEGMRMMTDPNFLHAGDHVHLGPGVVGTRLTNPAFNIEDLPPIDFVLLSHYHADHFDQKVEEMLRKDLTIVSTPHAHKHLSEKGFEDVRGLDVWESMDVEIKTNTALVPRMRITAMPGKHVTGPVVETLNNIFSAIPPTNGWMLELGYGKREEETTTTKEFEVGYTIYISGDTLLVKDLEEIPKKYPHVDLMLVHLGGTTIPGPHLPLLMLTMDAVQGIKLVHLIHADVTIPIHFDDYDVFLSHLSDFRQEVEKMGIQQKVIYLDRGDKFRFEVRHTTP